MLVGPEMSRLTAIIAAVACLIVCLGWLAMHYHNAASKQQTRRNRRAAD
jgi:hypothetical protein